MNGSGRVRLQEVAAAAGVSTITVSRCLSNPDRVSERTRAKVLRVAEAMGYIPNRLASGLASSRTMVVGVILPTVANPIHSVAFEALSEQLAPEGYQMLLGSSGYDRDREFGLVQTFLAHRVDAIVLTGRPQGRQTEDLLRTAGIPVVEMVELRPDPIDVCVGLSNFDAGAAMARHMVARGRRRLAFVCHEAIDDTRMVARMKGFVSTATAMDGVECRTFADARAPGTSGEAVTSAILNEFPEADGIVFSGHQSAVGAIRFLTDQGIAVPDRIAVGGFGDSPIARWVRPALTTIGLPMKEIGTQAGRLLLRRLQGQSVDAPVVNVGFEIIRRESA